MALQDLDLSLYQVVLNEVKSELAGFTHNTQQVTWTATMKNGSILDGSGVELASGGANTSEMVIDDLTVRNLSETLEVGDVLDISVARRGCIFNEDLCVFTDGAINAPGRNALEQLGNGFATVVAAA